MDDDAVSGGKHRLQIVSTLCFSMDDLGECACDEWVAARVDPGDRTPLVCECHRTKVTVNLVDVGMRAVFLAKVRTRAWFREKKESGTSVEEKCRNAQRTD